MGVSQEADADLLVIGGGINGTGIARDAAGRGLGVVLCEKDDLAQATSSASTKLIHGGLRYLEHYEFRLVSESLKEREILLRSAPHIIWPLRFVLPHHVALRPRWLIRMGLFLYDHLGGRSLLPASAGLDLSRHPAGPALKSAFHHGFEYSDCWVQDARLVVLAARDAACHGADIRTRTECVELVRGEQVWTARFRDTRSGEPSQLRARGVVNAAGPWVSEVLGLDSSARTPHRVRLVKGSHVVVPRLYEHEYPYIFQNADGRVLFAIPYEQDFTLLGTTDMEIDGDPGKVSADAVEVEYICAAISEYLRTPVSASDVVWSYAGVRPLLDDESESASKITRDYVLDLNRDGSLILSVFGGKITTFRKLAEHAVDMLTTLLPSNGKAWGKPWTAEAMLPGGDLPDLDFEAYVCMCAQRYPWLSQVVVRDYVRNYGSEIHVLLDGRDSLDGMGRHFGAGLYEAEVRYLTTHEWAMSAEDILWRRSKKGLRLDAPAREALVSWLEKEI